MGSGQSSAGKSETFTIDANGKVSRVSRHKPKQTEEASDIGTSPSDNIENHSTESGPGSSITSEQKEASPAHKPLSTSNNMQQQSGPSDQLRLREIDDILNRMKAKYKPNSTEMAGKGKSVFEDIENRLLHCYKVNKNEALKCATLAEEYRGYVEKQRAEILVKSAKT